MEIKKSKSANQADRSSLYLLIGLNLSLLIILGLLELTKMKTKISYFSNPEFLIPADSTIILSDIPRPIEELIKPPEIPEIPVEVEIIPDDHVLEIPDQTTPTEIEIPNNFQSIGSPAIQREPPILPERMSTIDTEIPDEPLTIINAKRGPIYPGCEKFIDNNKDLYKCFNEKFGGDLLQFIDPGFELESGTKAKVNINFQIDKEGNLNLIQVKANNTGETLSENATSAFAKLALKIKKLNNKRKGIVPAINTNNENQAFQYTVPISFVR